MRDSEIYVVSAGGGTLTQLTTGGDHGRPSWQAVPETTPPTITLSSPADGASFAHDSDMAAGYSCADEPGGSGLSTCSGSVASGASLATSTLGAHSFTVNATDHAGNHATVTHDYTVVPAADLYVSLGNSRTHAPAGARLTYTITVMNEGPDDAAGVSLVTPVPSGTTLQSITQTYGPAFSCGTATVNGVVEITCTPTGLASYAEAQFDVVLLVDQHPSA